MAHAGFELPDEHILMGQWSQPWGRAGCAQILRRLPDVDGIFCGSDQIARGVADTLREAGKRIPEDVAVVGFDNWDVMIDGSRPPLTTVDPKLTLLGRRAGTRLVNAIDGGELGHGTELQPCELVIRQSTV
jgi:LacI family transcriptional regulator